MSDGGRRVIVTAAARGIGRAILDRFAWADDHVVGIDIRKEILSVDGWPGTGRHFGITADFTSSDQVRSALDEAVTQLGGVDVLVNVAGGMHRPDDLQWYEVPTVELPEASLIGTFALNVVSALIASQRAAQEMIPQGAGCIINMGSGFGDHGSPRRVPYGVAKAAITSLTTSLAMEWGPSGIRVNEVVPYAVTDATRPRLEDARTGPQMVSRIPLGYLAHPEEVAPVVFYLASHEARYVTGARLHVDGGRCLQM